MYYTSRQCEGLRQRTVPTSKWWYGGYQIFPTENHNDNDEGYLSLYSFHDQTTMKRANCCRSLDGIKHADKFNIEDKCSMRNAETRDMKRNRNQNHSITITLWTVVCYIFVSPSMLNLNSRCSIMMWELKMSSRTRRMCLFTSCFARLSCWWLTKWIYYFLCCVRNHSEFKWFLLCKLLIEWLWT